MGFELNWKTGDKTLPEKLKSVGEEIFKEHSQEVHKKLDKFLLPNGNFDASAMRESWFPQVKADVFISHSHLDNDKALMLAGFLKENFGLKAFIDSCVWGYSNDLLKQIDKAICYKEKTKTYDYDKRNYTTTHVHMILSAALNEMIYNTETLFFLNTHKSISTSTKEMVKKTESGWIYSELKMSKLIEKRPSSVHRKGKRYFFSKAVNEGFEYKIDTGHLHSLSWNDLDEWKRLFNERDHPLDQLYDQMKNRDQL
ncbi:MAG: hypothetical protein QNK23_16430 [Crocinitomicaceae bacterium]|nr:hypothetical protein [Crocinitomicaceae bacterium]